MPDPADLAQLGRLLDTMAALRAPDGCPWDREQTFRSLRPHVIEEAHELAAAIDSGDPEAVCEESGDLLLQVVFLARIALEEGRFGMADVARGIADKLVRRHPHVFGDAARAEDPAEALRSWEAMKAKEKPGRKKDGLPPTLPALLLAPLALARGGGEPGPVGEALAEFEAEGGERALGELLFRIAAAAGRAGLDPEAALRLRALGGQR